MASIHISGISSGTDYASMIEQLMEVRGIPIETKETALSELDYDLGAWSEVNTQAADLTTSLDTLRGYDLWHSTSAESSDESVVAAVSDTGSAEQDYAIEVTSLATAHSVSSDAVDTSLDLIASGYVSEGDVFEVQGEEVTIEADETLLTLRAKINAAALDMTDEDRVWASIVNNHLVLTRENTGSDLITLTDVTGTALQGLGMLDSSAAIKNENVTGQDALFSVNGISVTRSSNSTLDDVVEGLTISLEGEGAATISIEADRDAVETAINDFIEKYNTLAAQVDEYSSIELGGSSELSTTGELYGDSLINSIRLKMRTMVTSSKSEALDETNASYTYEGLTGVMDNLSDIGIWTSGEDNVLSFIDEDRFDDMLENEFENMALLFKGVYDEDAVAYQDGVASDFYQYMNNLSASLTGEIDVHLALKTSEYDTIADQIEELESALEDYEEDLWTQFTLMEDALANMEYQSSYIESMFTSS